MRTTLATALDGELRADGDKVNDLSLERMAMLRHGVNDIKFYYEGDVRCLEQF